MHEAWQELRDLARAGEHGALRRALDDLHVRAMNDPLWHARCHWAYARLAQAEGRPGLMAAELRLMGFAPLASVARRLARLEPGEPGGPSLWGTVRLRWQPRDGRVRNNPLAGREHD